MGDARIEATLVTHSRSPDAMAWLGRALDVPHDAARCIHPAPFGMQCTAHSKNSLAACLSLKGCRALTCPSQEPYVSGRAARQGIRGAICQPRSTSSEDAWRAPGSGRLAARHGMCAPSGCDNLFLFGVQIAPDVAAKSCAASCFWTSLPLPVPPLVVLPAGVPAAVTRRLLGLGDAIGTLTLDALSHAGRPGVQARARVQDATRFSVFALAGGTPRRLHEVQRRRAWGNATAARVAP